MGVRMLFVPLRHARTSNSNFNSSEKKPKFDGVNGGRTGMNVSFWLCQLKKSGEMYNSMPSTARKRTLAQLSRPNGKKAALHTSYGAAHTVREDGDVWHRCRGVPHKVRRFGEQALELLEEGDSVNDTAPAQEPSSHNAVSTRHAHLPHTTTQPHHTHTPTHTHIHTHTHTHTHTHITLHYIT